MPNMLITISKWLPHEHAPILQGGLTLMLGKRYIQLSTFRVKGRCGVCLDVAWENRYDFMLAFGKNKDVEELLKMAEDEQIFMWRVGG